jgi:hypothetical protein
VSQSKKHNLRRLYLPRVPLHAWLGLVLLAAAALTPHSSTAASPDYLREIKPLLARKCYPCHSALKQKANLRLDTVQLMLKGGKSGAAISPGNPDRSLFIHRVTAEDQAERMPQESSALTKTEIELLKNWIKQGAVGPPDEKPQQDPARHWSYLPPIRPAIPAVSDPNVAIQNPIDSFLEQARSTRNLSANSQTDKAALLRRVYLDLIGLPPTPAELSAFESDTSPLSYENVVAKLLDDPRHGERWGRHWMDVWRYSDWYGRRGVNEIRYSVRHIWRWRDWIVESINNDKGYDRMIVEMLAGDEAAPTDPDALAATGFIGRNWYKFDRNVWLSETVERTSQAFLGLTLRCARCHDHKYDPITQEDYYRFRAFFEPHGVRTDRVDARTQFEKDNNKDLVLKEGLSRVFDKDLDAPTYLFQRGDDRRPDKTRPLSPRAPVSLQPRPMKIQPVALPVEAYYPTLRPALVDGAIELLKQKVAAADNAIEAAHSAQAKLATQIAEMKARAATNSEPSKAAFFSDDFTHARTSDWKTLNGAWKYSNGRLVQDQVTSFATMVSMQEHPNNFRTLLQYRTLKPGGVRSVGFSFDFVDRGHSQDVYTSTGDERQSVQAFHRKDGRQHYPSAGIVRTPIKLGELTTVEIEARGQRLSIKLNGEQKLDYVMPIPRRSGKFALWVHNGAAEFHKLEITDLRPTRDDLIAKQPDAESRIQLAKLDARIARAELASLQARAAAERAAHARPPTADADRLAIAASRAEKSTLAIQAEKELMAAEHYLASLKAVSGESKAAADAQKKIAAAKKKLTAGRIALDKPGSKFAPLGETFPKTSTGRRLALARWIAAPSNPRTARVAVNHIWLRHFGTPLVASVANFGIAGKSPTHPELLDWLAVELVESGWSMKRLHWLMTTSAAYRMSSKTERSEAAKIDSKNRYYWRANSRRMEAEQIRDGILHAAGNLSAQMNGPELAANLGQTSARRSLYFRTTPDSKMEMLDLFDLANPNACYERRVSVVPQQALTLMNSGLSLDQARLLARRITETVGAGAKANESFIRNAFVTVLNRQPTPAESKAMAGYLQRQTAALESGAKRDAYPAGGTSKVPPAKEPLQRARELLVHTLFNHNEFVTVR